MNERMSKAKIAKAEKKAIWIKKIMYAKMKADEAITINPSDELLCCNLDSAMIKKEKDFTYAEIIQIFNECSESAFQLSGLHQGWLLVGGCHGVAEKNTFL